MHVSGFFGGTGWAVGALVARVQKREGRGGLGGGRKVGVAVIQVHRVHSRTGSVDGTGEAPQQEGYGKIEYNR